MAKAKKLSLSKKITIVGVILIALQAGLLIYYKSQRPPLTAKQAIEEAVSSAHITDSRRREQMKVQAAIRTYQQQNGRLPKDLQELVPVYFDFVPIDPSSGKPFDYRIDGKRFHVGDSGEATTSDETTKTAQNLTTEEQESLITSLNNDEEDKQFTYDSTGKRDPFLPFSVTPDLEDPNKGPLEHFSLGQLKLTAVLEGMGEPAAIVETSTGKGFTVKKGMKIGADNGTVVEILPDKLMILEETTDFTGKKKTRTVELKLRTRDEQDSKSGARSEPPSGNRRR